MSNRATFVRVCVFGNTPNHRAFDQYGDLALENLTAEENLAWNVANEAALQIQRRYNYLPVVAFCPWDLDNNNAVTAENGLFNLPALLISAEYPDGTGRLYPIGKDLGDKFFGLNWKTSDVYPYFKSMYLNQFSTQEQSALCKLIPPLCLVGAYGWLALMAVSAYKAVDSKGKPLTQAAWGGAFLLSFNELNARGGFEAIFKKKT